MKYTIFLLFFFPFQSIAQQGSFKLCDSLTERRKPQYYSLKVKYPQSSEMLVEEANHVIINKSKNINGFITIRFIVNCKGLTGKYKVLQIDKNYQEVIFDHKYVEQILNFVQNLQEWKLAFYKDESIDYYTYFTFKIENGIVTEIVP
jgi:hypothetical protein